MPLPIERVAIDGATREALTPLGLPDVVADDWARFAGPQVRTLLVARGSAGDVAGAAITSGRPLAGYSVALAGPDLPPSCSVVASATAGPDGRFTLEDVPTAFRYQFEVRMAKSEPPWDDSWASAALRFEPIA